MELLRVLIKEGADVNEPSGSGKYAMTPLASAVNRKIPGIMFRMSLS